MRKYLGFLALLLAATTASAQGTLHLSKDIDLPPAYTAVGPIPGSVTVTTSPVGADNTFSFVLKWKPGTFTTTDGRIVESRWYAYNSVSSGCTEYYPYPKTGVVMLWPWPPTNSPSPWPPYQVTFSNCPCYSSATFEAAVKGYNPFQTGVSSPVIRVKVPRPACPKK